MKLRALAVLFALVVAALLLYDGSASSQAPDIIKSAQQTTTDLVAAEKALNSVRGALQSAKNSLDVTIFNSAAYNAKITSEQVKAAKIRLDKAEPREKEDALEKYELAMELAERRKAELEAAEKLLPQREAALKAAQEKFNQTLPAALKLADASKAVQREAESDLAAKVQVAKLAIEKASFAQAAADKTVQANSAITRAMAELAAADKAILECSAALQKEPGKDLARKTAEAEKATQAYAVALQAVVKHIPSLCTCQDATAILKVTAGVIKADRAVQEAAAALQKAKTDLQNKTTSAKAAADRAKAAQAKVDTSIAKIAARKSAQEAQIFAEKTEAARVAAEKAQPSLAGEVEQATKKHAAALQTAMQPIIKDAERSLAPARAALSKAMAAREAEINKENEAAARTAAEAKAAADKADAARLAAEKVAASRRNVRQALDKALRQRHYAELTAAQIDLSKLQKALNDKVLQPKVAALNKASETYKNARTAETDAATALAAAQTALQKAPAKDKKAAESTVKNKDAAYRAAQEKVVATKAARDKAREEVAAEESKLSQSREQNRAAYARMAEARAAAQGGLKPLPESAWDYAKARHLLVRAGFGGTPDEVARLHAMGLHQAVDYLVNYKDHHPAVDLPFTAYPKERPLEYEKGLPANERNLLNNRRMQKEAKQIQDMRNWWMRRLIESPRPLEEKLTLFWHGHFAVQYSTAANSYYMYLQNQLFRENANGNFATLLYGIAHDAAMLNYLNNDTNVKGRPNENLAREIMELFGMGRDQGYTEIDIRQGARALTGYTYDFWTGQFRHMQERHDSEPKTIFGRTGNWCGDDFVRLILETPYPSRFIARQLFVFFAHDEPSLDTIEALAEVLTVNNYELAPLLENLFASEEFYSSQAMGTQIKGPIQLLVGLHRDLGLKDGNYPYLVTAGSNMGQYLFEPPSVFGWPAGRTWINSTRVFIRYNALADVLESVPRGGKTGVDIVGTLLAGKKFQTHAEVVDYLVRCCMTVPLSEAKRQALIESLSSLPPPSEWTAQSGTVNPRLTRLLAILICSPEYQLT